MTPIQRFHSWFLSTFTKKGKDIHPLKEDSCEHNWVKFMGAESVGDGQFIQRYKCSKCKTIRKDIK